MLTFLGDVALFEDELRSGYRPKGEYIFNFEYVLGCQNEFKPYPNKINLIGKQSNYEELFGKKPIVVSLANNHINDFGYEGRIATENNLNRTGIQISCGNIIELDKVFILSYMDLRTQNESDIPFVFNKEQFETQIDWIKNRDRFKKVVLLIHWGIENSPNPSDKQVELAHWLIDSGVDLIIGNHPHCIQPIEIYSDKYIFYSLGNCLFSNINQLSHYDSKGVPQRKYRFKWQSWNRESLAVNYDAQSGAVTVDLLYQKQNVLSLKKENIQIEKFKLKSTNNSIVYFFRKYYLFFISNFCVDGKLFDFNAVRSEIKK